MGLLDFIFGNKKKEEQERLERERLAEQERRRQEEMRKAAEQERKRQEEKRIAEEQERKRQEEIRKAAELERKRQEEKRRAEEQKNSAKKVETEVTKPDTEKYPVNISLSEQFQSIAGQANYAFCCNNQQEALKYMNLLFKNTYGQNGHKLLNVSPENCQPVGLAFANIAIHLDFNDRDLNSVAAENAFYCLAKNFISKGNTFTTPALFTLLLNHSDLLKDKLIATHCTKAQKDVGMPIGMMLGGNPYKAPHLGDFREQAVSKRIPMMSYLIQFIYDIDSTKYKVPTDLPYLIPTLKEIDIYKNLVSEYGSSLDEMKVEGQKYFYGMFEECEETLSKC